MSENNIIPSSEIYQEYFFKGYEGHNILPEVLNQADYFGPNLPTNINDGQCLAVSVTEVMQTKLNLASIMRGEANADPPILSVQNLVDDMTPKPPGYPQTLFNHLQTNGIVTEQDYNNAPIGNDGRRNLEGLGRCRIMGYKHYYCGPTTMLQSHRREEALSDLMSFGPLIGELNCTKELWGYKSGVLKGSNYATSGPSRRVLTHAAMIVGYGYTVSGDYYWIMRNNWGRNYGDNGYFRVIMDLVSDVYSLQF